MSTSRPQRRYGDDEQAHALAVLAECNGDAAAASRITGIPASTLKDWRAARVRPASPELVARKRLERAAKWEEVQDLAVDQVIARIDTASARDAAVVAGIATDKALLLRATDSGTQAAEDSDRLALFRERWGEAQAALHVHLHLPGPPPEPPTTPARGSVVEIGPVTPPEPSPEPPRPPEGA